MPSSLHLCPGGKSVTSVETDFVLQSPPISSFLHSFPTKPSSPGPSSPCCTELERTVRKWLSSGRVTEDLSSKPEQDGYSTASSYLCCRWELSRDSTFSPFLPKIQPRWHKTVPQEAFNEYTDPEILFQLVCEEAKHGYFVFPKLSTVCSRGWEPWVRVEP